VRVVGATNADLPRLAAEGRFRADLMDRLAFDVIHVPPLRARPEDIPTLAYHFAVNVTSELKRDFFPGFSPKATAALLAYDWPGNVRELKNTVERSVYRAANPEEPLEEIIFDPFESPFGPLRDLVPASAPAERRERPTDDGDDRERPIGNGNGRWPIDFRTAVAGFERETLEQALERSKYKQTVAARLLGLSYHQLRGLLKKHGLKVAREADG